MSPAREVKARFAVNVTRRRRGRPGLTVLAVGALLTAGAVGCGSVSPPGSSTAAAQLNLSKLSGTLSIMGFGTNGDDVAQTRYKIAEAAMPHVRVSAPNGGFSDQSFLAAEASGNPPDLVYITAADLGTYAAKGALIPMTSCLRSAGISMSTFSPGARQEVTYDGSVYGLPEFTEDTTIVVSNSALAKARLSPSDISTSNWSKLLQTVKKLTVLSGGKPTEIGFDSKVEALFPLWAKANGGAIVSPNGLTAELNSPQDIQALAFTKQLVDAQGGGNGFYSFRNTLNYFGNNNPIATGQLAATVFQDWFYQELASTTPNVKVTAVPFTTRSGRPIDLVDGQVWAIPKGAHNVAAACKWAQVMTETSTWLAAARERIALYKKEHYQFTGLMTGNQVADAGILKLFKSVTPPSSPWYQPVSELFNVEQDSFTVPVSPASEAVANAWEQAVQSVVEGHATPAQALDQAQSQAQNAISQART
jgi:multiple sugar transport system substrate-binding protein